ncbi:SusC/RagA family TonB-linked outer membrane protein [Sphingobacterium sp. LRF_L2]|uniref:SusC/RagA family TonB-linked outer membrane protein n=1 Tax=Sphingobacterium sp. LRF_L2 TaxID=3369421 RepID=UPI003F6062FE
MKITTSLLLFFITCVYADSNAQKVSLSLNNAKLEDVFTQISKQTDYKFLYSDDVVKRSTRINVNVQNAELKDVLKVVLPNDNYSFRIIAETISVVYKGEKVEKEPTRVFQNRISGTINGTDGAPLIGASILVKGTSIGATTGATGEFTIIAESDAVLVVRYVGYKNKEIAVANRSHIAIVLESEDNTIETVVATGYQNLDRKLFTGASSKVLAKDAQRAGVPDISRMLEGQVAGVSVQNVSGTFGAAPKIRVRGATSLSGDNKPLWVIDGIIMEDVVNISNEALSTGDANTLIGSSVAGLNPDDIESFNILKDAAATAMYGARAMNGVVVVTTKKGRNTEGKPNVNYSGTYTTYLKPNYDQFDIMNSAEQMSVLLEMENKGYFNHSPASRAKTGGIFTKMYNLLYDYDEATNSYALKNTYSDRLAFLERYAKANTDWFDVLFKNSLLQEHSLSINSGTANSQTYFSTSALMDNGQTLGDNVKRYTVNFRNSLKMSDKFSAEMLFNGSIRDQRTPGTLTRASDPVYGQYSRSFDINPYSYALNTSRLITPYDENGDLEYFTRNYADFNILNELNSNYLKLTMLDMKVQGGIRYKILPQLTYSADGAYRYAKSERQHYVLEGSNMVGALQAAGDAIILENNDLLYSDPDYPNELPVVVLPEGGFYNTTLNSIKNYYLRNNLEFDQTFNQDHRLNIFGSMEIRYTDRQFSDYEGIGYQYENGGLVNPNYRYFKKMIEGGDPYFGMYYTYDRFAAAMGRVAYAYKDRYSVNSTIRYDGSNLMGSSNTARWLPTWNVSGAWNVDQEEFFNNDNRTLTAARIRGTYGLVASMGNANNSSTVYYNRVTYRPYEDEKESQIYIDNLTNTDLTWEKLYEFNLGTDLTFFNNINITFDWYKRNIFDLIGGIRTSGIGGQYNKSANFGEMKSHGVEFTIAGSPIKRESGFGWRTQFNFAVNKNEVTRLDVNQNIWTLVRAEGAPLLGHSQRGLYSIQFDGLDPNYGYPTYIGTEGIKDTYIYLQSTDIDYLKYHGPVDPTFTGGFYNQFSYKNFSFSALFTFAAGNWVRLQPTYSIDYNDYTAVSKDMVNRWIMPGDEAYTNIPAILDEFTMDNKIYRANGSTVNPRYTYNAYNYSDQRVAKGDFIRLKTISINYQLPSQFIKRLKMSNASVSLVGNNIALLYSDDRLNGADPEFFNNGGVAMPVPRQYTLSLKIGF